MNLQERMFDFALMGGEWVLWVLIILSAVCITIAIERLIYGRMNRTPVLPFQETVSQFLQGGETTDFKKSLTALKGMESKVLLAGIEAAEKGGHESAEEALAGHLTFEKLKLERGLIVIGTTGSNAPFIGLFGTVLGIIKAFKDLSIETAEAASSVMAGISEALVATAVGLLVAIPAVIIYNYFQQRNRSQISQLQSIGHLILARLKSQHKHSKPEEA